jgi:high-affinity Fe2+/Pb2+ permease
MGQILIVTLRAGIEAILIVAIAALVLVPAAWLAASWMRGDARPITTGK